MVVTIKTEIEHIKRLTTKDKIYAFSSQTFGAGDQKNKASEVETLSHKAKG